MIDSVRRYVAFSIASSSMRLAFRGAVIVGVATNLLGLVGSLLVWRALFDQQAAIAGFSWNELVLYALVAFTANSTLSFATEQRISNRVLEGTIESDLRKPVDFQLMSFFDTAGSAVVEGTSAVLVAALTAITIGVSFEDVSTARVLLSATSMVLGFSVKFGLAYLAGVACFYTSNGFGVIYLRQVVTGVFSGAMLPLDFFPGWLRSVAVALPFQATVHVPAQILLGRGAGAQLASSIGLQLFWSVFLWILARLVFRAAVRKITVHGG